MVYTYPVSGNPLSGSAADALAFLKSPTLIAKRMSELLSEQSFLSHYLLKGRYTMTGGAMVMVPTGMLKTSGDAERVAPGAEYTLVTVDPMAAEVVRGMKTGIASEVTDESVGRLAMQPVEDTIAALAYNTVRGFDTGALSLIDSTVANSTTATAKWTTDDANGTGTKAMVRDLSMMKAKIKGLRKGYGAEFALVLTEDQYAQIQVPMLPLLPRESNNPIVTGNWPSPLGMNIVTGDHLPTGWVPKLIDLANFGGIGHENIPSPEYVGLGVNGGSVEVARFREANDSTRIQVRKADAPVIVNADAAIEITGAF